MECMYPSTFVFLFIYFLFVNNNTIKILFIQIKCNCASLSDKHNIFTSSTNKDTEARKKEGLKVNMVVEIYTLSCQIKRRPFYKKI